MCIESEFEMGDYGRIIRALLNETYILCTRFITENHTHPEGSLLKFQ
jgi:hypothetical protein